MKFIHVIIRPDTFEVGEKYLLRLRHDNNRDPVYVPVKFVNYGTCPAIVSVSGRDGKLWRISREDLFTRELVPTD